MISAQVRLLILKESDVEERHFILAQIAALQKEMEQQLFFYNIMSRYDEVPQFRNWIEKQDTTYGPLYARTFKRWQDELRWRPDLLYPSYLQHQPISPLYLRLPSPYTIIFSGGSQNRPSLDYRLPGENAVRNFNTSFLHNLSPLVPPNLMDLRLPMPPVQLPQFSANFQLPLQFPSSSKTENA
ncbi:unnamed protein product [Acanthocheilonema viteae]|uniref:Uncharacterized protein n=1 Tax=Acanthocheilonema viteae TaxID=6277 RepID=A0A498S1F8_ACAVI|nr:unnamed protein product [Acanthocheilonema viteae]